MSGVQTRVCGIGELSFSDDCVGVRLRDVRSYPRMIDEIERYTVELIMRVLMARPPVADLLLGAPEQR